MLKLKFVVLALSAGIMAAPAIAAETVDPVPAKPDQGGDARTGDPNRIICRRESITGSRLGSNRRCMTAAEWASVQQDTREKVERAQSYTPTHDQ